MPRRIHSIINPAASHLEYTHNGHARQIAIKADTSQPVQVDGEIWGNTPLTIQVMPGAVSILTPGYNPTA